MELSNMKKEVIGIYRSELERQANIYKESMEYEQATANEHVGAMESRYDTFKEEAQDRKSALAKQLSNVLSLLSLLFHIKSNPSHKVEFGSIVFTNEEHKAFFMFPNVLENDQNISDWRIQAISPSSPIGKNQFLNKQVGDEIEFLKRKYRITGII